MLGAIFSAFTNYSLRPVPPPPPKLLPMSALHREVTLQNTPAGPSFLGRISLALCVRWGQGSIYGAGGGDRYRLRGRGRGPGLANPYCADLYPCVLRSSPCCHKAVDEDVERWHRPAPGHTTLGLDRGPAVTPGLCRLARVPGLGHWLQAAGVLGAQELCEAPLPRSLLGKAGPS